MAARSRLGDRFIGVVDDELRAEGRRRLERARRLANQGAREKPKPAPGGAVAAWGRYPVERAILSELERFELHHAPHHFSTCAAEPAVEDAARALTSVFAAELGIEQPRAVRFFSPETAGERAYIAERGVRDWPGFDAPVDLNGYCDRAGREVWIHADLPFVEALAVLAHEIRHLAPGGDEAAAYAYAAAWKARLPRLN